MSAISWETLLVELEYFLVLMIDNESYCGKLLGKLNKMSYNLSFSERKYDVLKCFNLVMFKVLDGQFYSCSF